MGTRIKYLCKECGHTFVSSNTGHDHGFRAHCFYMFCPTCRDVVSIPSWHLDNSLYPDKTDKYWYLHAIDESHCPNCQTSSNELRCWNPVDLGCPKCRGELDAIEYSDWD